MSYAGDKATFSDYQDMSRLLTRLRISCTVRSIGAHLKRDATNLRTIFTSYLKGPSRVVGPQSFLVPSRGRFHFCYASSSFPTLASHLRMVEVVIRVTQTTNPASSYLNSHVENLFPEGRLKLVFFCH